MANADTPFGLRPVYNSNGSPYNGNALLCAFAAGDAVAAFVGDPVKLTGTAEAVTGIPIVAQCAATDAIYGVIVGLEPNRADLTLNYRVASTVRYAMVCVDKESCMNVRKTPWAITSPSPKWVLPRTSW